MLLICKVRLYKQTEKQFRLKMGSKEIQFALHLEERRRLKRLKAFASANV